MNPKNLAASVLQLLQEDHRRYRAFGVYWYLIKGLLKHYYSRDNLSILGDFTDQSVIDRMPQHESLEAALTAAVEEFNQNVSFAMGSNQVPDPTGGGVFTLLDQDAGL